MQPILFGPDERYQTKLLLTVGLIGLASFLGGLALAIPIGLDAGGGAGVVIGLVVIVVLAVVCLTPAFVLMPLYYRSLRYEIHDDEVIVRGGVITHSVKHVPFRTVTNLKVTRGPLDRLLGIGAVHIQTAGMSGQTGAEETLAGLTDYNDVYQQVAGALRRFRGAMAPTQAEEELAVGDEQVLAGLLREVRAIRELMEKQ